MNSSKSFIHVNKSRVHNLKNLSVSIPKNKLTIITGPSGCGKSSLAFDTIYIEGQRRYIESLSSYARQFLGQFQPPDVDSIDGLSPAIAIDQKVKSKNPRSTVGTITEIYDYMRILFARFGILYCLKTQEEVRGFSPSQIVNDIIKNTLKSKIIICANLKIENDFNQNLLNSLGYTKFLYKDEILQIEDNQEILNKEKIITLVIDRIILKENSKKRLLDSIDQALEIGKEHIIILINDKKYNYSTKFMGQKSGIIYPELEPKLFSFNSPVGACPECNGIGRKKDFSISKMINDSNLSLLEGALKTLNTKNRFLFKMIKIVAKIENVDLSVPFYKLPEKFKNVIFHGSKKIYKYQFISERSKFEFQKKFPGILKSINKKYHETTSDKTRQNLEKYMDITECSSCNGLRLNKIALSTLINGKNIMSLSNFSIESLLLFMQSVEFSSNTNINASKRLIQEIKSRLNFLIDVGLDYLTLNRSAVTLSGGESQRIRLATQIGSALSGVIYVLDEPSIGLHQKDNEKLIKTLKHLRDIGNTVIVVEHDLDTILASDYVVDIGPGAGIHGGNLLESLPIKKFLKSTKSITAKYLNDMNLISTPKHRRKSKNFITIKGACANNLKSINISIPLKTIACISGVSGSGKSSLMHQVFIPAISSKLKREETYLDQKMYKSLSGTENLKQIISLDQTPIGRTPRSNPATYTSMFDTIREIFAKTNESNARGYKPGRFSFNIKGGRCPHCQGDGVIKIEMHFLPDVYITCSECNGTRYNDETLEITYKSLNIAQVLNLTVEESFDFFKHHTKLNRIISSLISTGLGYIKLSQPATTLSGGEAQRLKLSKELSKQTKGDCLYILDEPTTGLHVQDVKILLKALNALVDKGHSVVIIEHNLDVIRASDYIIDLGPDGGEKGGHVVAVGTPEQVAKVKESHTGRYLNL